MKKITALLLAITCLLCVSCGKGTKKAGELTESGNYRMSFADATKFDEIAKLDGRTVEIVGYMATVSPPSGEYMYLMNLPYQSCPYCIPNTSTLANTIAVYAPSGEKFEFTDRPINVVGTLETGDFTDEYDYNYSYRIADATYEFVDSSEASDKLALWERITNIGLASDMNTLFDYVDFMCNWPNYTAKFDGENDEYLWPADVANFQGSQYSTQSAANYFDTLAKHAEGLEDDRMDELVNIIYAAQTLVNKAQSELDGGFYTSDENKKFTLTNGEAMMKEAQDLYLRYATWLDIFSLSNND